MRCPPCNRPDVNGRTTPKKEPAEGDACRRHARCPLAWDFGTSRWQLFHQATPFSAHGEASITCEELLLRRMNLLLLQAGPAAMFASRRGARIAADIEHR